MRVSSEELRQIIQEELEAVLDEKKGKKRKAAKKKRRKKKKKKKAAKKDACYHKVKSRYDVWPSAYASGALVKCRKVGAKNWGNSKKESLHEEGVVDPNDLRDILDDEGGAAGLEPMVKGTKSTEREVKDTLEDMDDVGKHKKGDYIKDDGKQIRVRK
jgi:hypothetical protein